MKKLIILLTTLLILSSCVITRNTLHIHLIDATIFQTLDSNTALAITDEFNTIQVITNEEVYYDGRKIVGTFVLVDTYAYETVQHHSKVVPVYVRWSEYKKYINTGRWK